jgi:hypothetical protein
MHGQRSRLLGSGILLLVAVTLALAACNSGSVAGNQSKPSTATAAEGKSQANGQRSQGLIGSAVSQIK